MKHTGSSSSLARKSFDVNYTPACFCIECLACIKMCFATRARLVLGVESHVATVIAVASGVDKHGQRWTETTLLPLAALEFGGSFRHGPVK